MKKFIYIILALTGMIFISSCDDYLDRELTTDLTPDDVTKSFTYTRSRVAGIYSRIIPGFLNINDAMMASATDESEHTIESSAVQMFNLGSWNTFSNPDNVWPTYYKAIRDVNLFLVSTDDIDHDVYKYDPLKQEVYQDRLLEIERMKHEVRFLRAYFYFELIKRYGGVPIITEATHDIDEDFSNVERNTLEQCIEFILSECDAVASKLPPRYDGGNLGRATNIAALALKSRLLLYRASDLWNYKGWPSGYEYEYISVSGDRTLMWQEAADAAWEVINLAWDNGYDLHGNYNALFSASNFTNQEILFARRDGPSFWFEKLNYSIGFDLGQSGTTPSQNLVDAYEMTNGKKIEDLESGYDPHNPYKNRDPRLHYTIITNNSMFKGRYMEMWYGGKDAPPIINSTRTGYYLKKYVNENLNLLTNQTSVHTWSIFRFAELCLNYAEALNESNPGHEHIKMYVDLVRTRDNVNMPVLPMGLSQNEMRHKIRNERKVELAFEDHRAWDARRWMIATEVFNEPLRGVKITKIEDNIFNYQHIKVEERIFEPKMYYYPIPQSEIMIANKLTQNPLW